jgi:alkylhydroperoxidase/carboxymuconolactone decarboxylase family protein YurZ
MPKPPAAYTAFVLRFPLLGQAWDLVGEAGESGPLTDREIRLVKLGIAVGAMREGAVHSSVRKAIATGMSPAEIEQVGALAAGTLGFPSAVAVYGWIRDLTGAARRPPRRR